MSGKGSSLGFCTRSFGGAVSVFEGFLKVSFDFEEEDDEDDEDLLVEATFVILSAIGASFFFDDVEGMSKSARASANPIPPDPSISSCGTSAFFGFSLCFEELFELLDDDDFDDSFLISVLISSFGFLCDDSFSLDDSSCFRFDEELSL